MCYDGLMIGAHCIYQRQILLGIWRGLQIAYSRPTGEFCFTRVLNDNISHRVERVGSSQRLLPTLVSRQRKIISKGNILLSLSNVTSDTANVARMLLSFSSIMQELRLFSPKPTLREMHPSYTKRALPPNRDLLFCTDLHSRDTMLFSASGNYSFENIAESENTG